MRTLKLELARAAAALGMMCAISLIASPRSAAAQELATITGVVTDQETGQPLSNVNISVVGTSQGATTGDDGRYTISSVNPAIRAIRARRVGYGDALKENVRVAAGAPIVIDFQLRIQPLRMNAVVTTGVTDPTSGAKAPVTVTRLTTEDMPVMPTGSVAGMIMGKVPGVQIIRGTGTQAGVNIQLRAPASFYKSNSPMFVLDGVVLSQTFSLTTADIESMDVESIEVIRGAAAASLYGSRAANGVISITTRRGTDLAIGTTQIQTRFENGFNVVGEDALKKIEYHRFLVNQGDAYTDANGAFVDTYAWIDNAGNLVAKEDRVIDRVNSRESSAFIDNPYRGPLYDHTAQFWKSGNYANQSASLSQNALTSNFNISITRRREPGVVPGNEGATSYNGRVNLDHRISDNLQVSLSASHNRSKNESNQVSYSTLRSIDPDVNLLAPGPEGSPFPYCIRCDSASTAVSPLFSQWNSQSDFGYRVRSLVSASMSYSPLSWLRVDGNIGYDRSDRQDDDWDSKGELNSNGTDFVDGRLAITSNYTDGLSGDLGATWLQAFGDLTLRTTARGLFEKEYSLSFDADGSGFPTSGIKRLDATNSQSADSQEQLRRALSGLVTSAFDYRGKYVGDALVRWDGSSLFGPTERWNTFYRVSAAYRMAEEPWWPFPAFNEFKLRFSRGTGGTRPGFLDQYEVLQLGEPPDIERRALGNPKLRPELSTENEISLDLAFKNRISLQLNYASRITDDLIIDDAVPGVSGFNTTQANDGKMHGATWEMTMQAQILRSRTGLSWDATLVADRTRHRMLEFNRPCYKSGFQFRCAGYILGVYNGYRHLTGLDQLFTPGARERSDEFVVDDNGFLVWVGKDATTGETNRYTDGVTKELWGTTTRIDGLTYTWGYPISARDSLVAGYPVLSNEAIADFNPWGNFGFSNNFSYKSLRFYFLINGQIGGEIYNSLKRSLYNSRDHQDLVEVGKPDSLKKPSRYYEDALVGGIGGGVGGTPWFFESGTYAKLSEAQLRWQVPQSIVQKVQGLGVDNVNLQLTGRNLFTWTKYSGYDPEVGSNFNRTDSGGQPRWMSVTAALNIVF